MAVDLHLHSTLSDGTDEPAILVERAVRLGLTALAVTDHDTFEGHAPAREAAAGRIEFIPGIELSVEWGGPPMHLLAWWVGAGSELDHQLIDVREGRARRNAEIVGVLNELGYPITMEQVERISTKGVAGRPHIAQALVEVGAVSSSAEAFDRFLANGMVAYRPRPRLLLEHAIQLVTAAGGVTAVAHPHTVADSADGFTEAFRRFAEAGVTGVECWYGEYPPEQREAMARMARRHGLVPTGGSDYHGDRKPGLNLGVGRGDLVVPDGVVAELAARRHPLPEFP